MKFVKRLIILTGSTSKGTLTLEKNAFGIWLKLNTFNLAHSPGRDLAVFSGGEVHIVRIDDSGKVACDLPLADPEVVHAAVISGGRVEMYGTNSPVRMTLGQVEEEYARKKFGGKNFVQPSVATEPSPVAQNTQIYTQRKIEDYFLDILPTYKDDAIADENYFEKERENLQSKSTAQTPITDILTEEAVEENAIKKEDTSLQSPQERGAVLDEDMGISTLSEEKKEKDPGNEPINGGKAFYSDIKAEETVYAEGEGVIFEPNGDASVETDEASVEIHSFKQDDGAATEKDPLTDEAALASVDSNENEDEAERIGLQPKNRQRPISRIFAKNSANEFEGRESVGQEKIKSLKSEKRGDSLKDAEVAATVNVLDINAVKKRFLGDSKEYRARRASFYEKNKDNLDNLFIRNKRYETLERLLPGSKWVKIDYDGAGRYYVVGITDDYLCYGVPATYSPNPPQELKGYCQWLPKNSLEPRGDGFWIIFQDLASGETVRCD